MFIPTLFSLLALFLSLFCPAVNGMPAPRVLLPRHLAPEPRSLLGRTYIRHSAPSIPQPPPGPFSNAIWPDSDFVRVGPIGRVERFHAIQSRPATFKGNERSAVFNGAAHS